MPCIGSRSEVDHGSSKLSQRTSQAFASLRLWATSIPTTSQWHILFPHDANNTKKFNLSE